VHLKHFIVRKTKPRQSLLIRTIWTIILLSVMLFAYTFIEPFMLEIKTVDIVSDDVPDDFVGTKIVFMSDIHHGPFFSKARLKRLVNQINSLEPDVVLLGGDYVHRDPKYIAPCFDELKELKAPLGKFGVLGNHDHWEGAQSTIINMKNAGIAHIDNKAVWIYKGESRIKIGGVGDFLEDVQDIEPTLEGVKEEDFVILVSHNPDYFEHVTTSKIDLVLSGHTHGGQVTFFGKWAPLIPSMYGQKYRTGTVQNAYSKIIISNGVGTITPPVRFFARPQINIINLKK